MATPIEAVRHVQATSCSDPECNRKPFARGLCRRHYNVALAAEADPCREPGCGEPSKARGWCNGHYKRWMRSGEPAPEPLAACLACGGPVPGAGAKMKYCGKPECHKAKRAAYYQANRERFKPGYAANYAANRESRAAAGKRWRQANPEKARAILSRYMARTDRPCCWPRCTTFALRNKPICRKHHAEDQGRRYARKRARKAGALYAAQNGMCPGPDLGGCGLPLGQADGNHIDHVIPRVRGGPDEDWNYQLMHPACNERKLDSLTPGAIALAGIRGLRELPSARHRQKGVPEKRRAA